MSQALSVSKGELVQVVVVAERGVHVQNGIRSLVGCFADIFHYYLLGLTSIVSAEKKTRGVLTLDQII